MVAGPDGNFLELDPEVKCIDDLTVPEGCKLYGTSIELN